MPKTRRVVFSFDDRSLESIEKLRAQFGPLKELVITNPETGEERTIVVPDIGPMRPISPISNWRDSMNETESQDPQSKAVDVPDDGWSWIRNKIVGCVPELTLPQRDDRLAGTPYEVMGWMHVLCSYAQSANKCYLSIAVEQQKRADEAEARIERLESNLRQFRAERDEYRDGNHAAHQVLDSYGIRREDVEFRGPIQTVTEYPVCDRIKFLEARNDEPTPIKEALSEAMAAVIAKSEQIADLHETYIRTMADSRANPNPAFKAWDELVDLLEPLGKAVLALRDAREEAESLKKGSSSKGARAPGE
jgi:hypothetical protein